MGGIAINDKCNLSCLYCSVSNRGIPDMTYEEVKAGLYKLYDKGIRNLYIEGGEPFLWEDGTKGLEDLIGFARITGFKFLTVYTNGTFAIESSADTVFVSLDGIGEINDKIRGKSYEKIIKNIHASTHKKIIINCTISGKNKDLLKSFCTELGKIKNIKGFFFYFYTASDDNDELKLNKKEKEKCIRTIIKLKKEGHRILNSYAGLKVILSSKWKRPNGLSYLYAEKNLYKCCRFVDDPKVCEECGYLGFPEIYLLSRLNVNAVLTAFKYL